MENLTLDAYVYCPRWTHPEQIIKGEAIPTMSINQRSDYFESEGYTLIGRATVTVALYSEDKMREQQLEALKGALQRERAATEVRQNAILDSISKLQAIEYHA